MKITKFVLVLSLLLVLICSPTNTSLWSYTHATLPRGVFGPKTFAFDCNGEGPYTGVADGRIFKWEGFILSWREFATTSPIRKKFLCDESNDTMLESIYGRPLGLQFHMVTYDLYVADVYFGLMRVNPNGGKVVSLVSGAKKIPFRLTNSLDIDYENGLIYFTDSSTRYQRREHLRSLQSGDATGRFMRYNIQTGQVTVLLRGLRFANGVVLSNDRTSVLVAETRKGQIRKYWLQGPKANKDEVFSQLLVASDNLHVNANGDVWVALNNGATLPTHKDEIIALRLDGHILEALHGDGIMQSVCEVQQKMGTLFIGSLTGRYMGMSTI